MEILIQRERRDTVIRLRGALDGRLAPAEREQVLAAACPGSNVVLDFSEGTELAGGGLRLLLGYCRHVHACGGTVRFRSMPPELQDLAEAAGFAQLFRRVPEALPQPLLPAPPQLGIDAYPSHWHSGFALRAGAPSPFGATLVPHGVNFAVFSRHAESCTLVLFREGEDRPVAEIPFPEEFRIGDVFAMTVFDLPHEQMDYAYRVSGPWAPERGHRFDSARLLLDPMARALDGGEIWGAARAPHSPYPRRARIAPEDFDWEGDRPLGLPIEDLVIYELHLRGFTADPSSGVRHPGTFAGLKEKIPYLQELGVNCVELLPIFEFDELENKRRNPRTGERLWNAWGYSTVAFHAPKAGFAATGGAGLQADELKTLVKALHASGIEVMLDVVFNHTAEGDEDGPTFSFRGLDNRTWYMLTPEGGYQDFSGCGNTFNCNHPVVRDFVVGCLRHWVTEYHIDGFRFDLASILGRDQDGEPLGNPPLLEALAHDPVLGRTKLVAEAWDAGGLYQVGSFPAYGRWAEWNGRYRDCLRRFLKGDAGLAGEMASRLSGSPDLYKERGPAASINFVTCHDGFTLADLVSYNEKHNEDNGEDNRDGASDNHSWNCGVEGATDDPGVQALRRRQVKNALAMLFLSQGVPMLLMGDESGRSQNGNNNAYCHDGPLTWMDWRLGEVNAELLRFCRLLVRLRRRHPILSRPLHDGSGGVAAETRWHGLRVGNPDWSPESRLLAFLRTGADPEGRPDAVYAALNMHWEARSLELPEPPAGLRWHVALNTGMATPEDIWEPDREVALQDPDRLLAGGRSTIVLLAR